MFCRKYIESLESTPPLSMYKYVKCDSVASFIFSNEEVHASLGVLISFTLFLESLSIACLWNKLKFISRVVNHKLEAFNLHIASSTCSTFWYLLKIPFSAFNDIIITCSYSNLPCIRINFSLKFDISLFGGAYKILAQLLRDFFVNFNYIPKCIHVIQISIHSII